MSKAKDKPAATNIKALELKGKIGQTEGQVISKAALTPAINAATRVHQLSKRGQALLESGV